MISRLVGTASEQAYPVAAMKSGFRAVWGAAIGGLAVTALAAGAQARKVHDYRLHEIEDRGAPFSMLVGPDHTVYTLLPRRDGQWILSEVKDWWQDKPMELGIVVEGFSSRDAVSAPGQMDLALTPDGQYLVTLLSARMRVTPDDPYPMDMLVEVVRLDKFEVVMTEHMRSLGIRGQLHGGMDSGGQLLVNSEVAAVDENGATKPWNSWFAVTVPAMKAHLACSYERADPAAMETACGSFAKTEGYGSAADLNGKIWPGAPTAVPVAPAGVTIASKDRFASQTVDVDGKPLSLVVVNGVDVQAYVPQ